MNNSEAKKIWEDLAELREVQAFINWLADKQIKVSRRTVYRAFEEPSTPRRKKILRHAVEYRQRDSSC